MNVEQRFSANESSDKAFEEIFKLIFTKLYDEALSSTDADIIASDINRHHQELKDIDDGSFRVMKFRTKNKDSLDEIYNNIKYGIIMMIFDEDCSNISKVSIMLALFFFLQNTPRGYILCVDIFEIV